MDSRAALMIGENCLRKLLGTWRENILFLTYVFLLCFLWARSEVVLSKVRNVEFAVDEVVCSKEPPEAILLLNV